MNVRCMRIIHFSSSQPLLKQETTLTHRSPDGLPGLPFHKQPASISWLHPSTIPVHVNIPFIAHIRLLCDVGAFGAPPLSPLAKKGHISTSAGWPPGAPGSSTSSSSKSTSSSSSSWDLAWSEEIIQSISADQAVMWSISGELPSHSSKNLTSNIKNGHVQKRHLPHWNFH